jgi:pimeloyl-ACP methyl ester carboxylesterase
MDLPGFGLTGPSPDADYTPETYARFVVQLMDGLAIKRAVLVGNSLGGGIAWLVAVTAPDRVGKLVLIDAAGYPQHAVSVPIGFKLAQMPLLAPVFTHILPRRVVEASLKDVYGDPSRVTPGLVDQYYDMTVRAGNRAALGQKMAQSHFEPLAGEIAQVKAPTLILWGTEDRLISPANAERFHKDIPGSVVVMLPGLGHVPMEEDPVGSLKAASVFLEE